MKTKEITLCGKPVTLGYCFAAEIAYKDLTGEDILMLMQDAVASIKEERMPDVKKSLYAILACMLAYYNSKGEDTPINDAELMNDASPLEIGTAIGAVLTLRAEFYDIPAGEPKDKPTKGKGRGKN